MTPSDYHRLYADLYADKDYAGEVEAVLALLDRQPARVLDVGCGAGAHAQCFARHGIQVVGVDLDPGMIMVAQSRAAAWQGGGDPPLFVCGGPATAPDGPYDLAVSLFNVVNYLPDIPSLQNFFQAIAARLPAGAPFIFDAWNGLAVLNDPPQVKRNAFVSDGRGGQVTTVPQLDVWNQVVSLQVEIGFDGGADADVIRHQFNHRLWTPREIADLLQVAGFAAPAVTTWHDTVRPAGSGDWKVLYRAVRQ